MMNHQFPLLKLPVQFPASSTTVIVYADANNKVSSASTSDDEMLATVTDHPRKKRNPSKCKKDKEKRLRSHSCGAPCGCT